MLSRKCQYALRGIVQLAATGQGRPVKTRLIAEQQGIPVRFLETIFAELKQTGLVVSRRGSDGGYMLAEKASQINMAQIVEALDGRLIDADAFGGGEEFFGCLALRELWIRADKAVYDCLAGKTVQDMVEQELAHQREFVPNYMI